MEQAGRVIFDGPVGMVGVFRCPPGHPQFNDSGPIHGGHVLVFPRTSVRITHEGQESLVADPNTIMFYNDQQRYRRAKLSARGDLCDWFGFSSQVVREAIQPLDPTVEARDERPFPFPQGPSDPQLYLMQRRVVDHLLGDAPTDPILVQELMIHVLHFALRRAYLARGTARRPSSAATQRANAALAHAAKGLIATRFQESLTLDEIARHLGCSPYHLCRVFRRHTGTTLHSHLSRVRLHTALEHLFDGAPSLTGLALTLGYSSHSHFTHAFRTTFGVPPSRIGDRSSRRLRELSKNLIATARASSVS